FLLPPGGSFHAMVYSVSIVVFITENSAIARKIP
ncbi:MAG: hypothetical protein ACI9K8_000272, partial [Reinekea sp.]